MKTISFLSNAIEWYVKYRKASGRNSHSYVKNVILFDHFCAREYPGQTELTQEIVDRWCWKIQCKLPPKTKRFCPLVLK